MKKEMSSFDIMAMVKELKRDMWIKKIFQPSPESLRIQLRFKEGGTANLRVIVGKAMYQAEYGGRSPKFPSNFAMTLRKYLTNSRVDAIRQVGFDRIVELSAIGKEGKYRLIFELFGEGNIILVDESGKIKSVMKPRTFKHRDLKGKERYEYPPKRLDPFEINPRDIVANVEEYGSLVKTLAVILGLGGFYSEEVCQRAGLRKDLASVSLDDAELVSKTLGELKAEALNPTPYIVYEKGEPIDVVPLNLSLYKNKELKEFPSFNDALNEYFGGIEVEGSEAKLEKEYKEGLTTLSILLRDQAKAIKRFNREIKSGRTIGDIIYNNFDSIKEILDIVSRARKSKPEEDVKEDIKGLRGVKKYLPKDNAIEVEVGGESFRLDLSLSASKNAEQYYNRSKKAKSKLVGARAAAEKTKEKIRSYVKEGFPEPGVKEKRPEERMVRKKRWYENFRWFISSQGFLVVGGRDATSNEVIVKRHMERGDLFAHADIHGAPAVVIKGEGKKIPEKTLEEACQFAASNSTAWKAGAAYLDTYWVNPDQVSKTPKSGEYVSKGAFIIRGKRNYIRSKLILSIGCRVNEYCELMSGPPDAVDAFTGYSVKLAPGQLKSRDAAQKIREKLLGMAEDRHKDAISSLNIDHIQRALPTGGYTLL